MQEAKNYILRNVKVLLNLDEIPFDLSDSSYLDKYLQSDQETILISCLPTKEFRVLTSSSKFPAEGHIIQITKLRSDGPLASFFNISAKPVPQYA